MQETLSSCKREVETTPASNEIIQKVVEPQKEEEQEPEQEPEQKQLPRVALIGREVPLPILVQYDVTVIQSNEIDQIINDHDYGEIWILTFELTRLQLFKLRTHLREQRVIEFHNIKELELYIHQERRVSI